MLVRVIIPVVIAGLTATPMAGCAGESPSPSSPKANASSAASESPGADTEGPASGGATTPTTSAPELAGLVMSVSDVADLPDVALGPASLLVVPLAVAEAFWLGQGFSPSGEDAPADFELNSSALPPEVVIEEVDADGRFRSAVVGAALLCLADLHGVAAPPSPPRFVQGGCVVRPASAREVTLQSEGHTTLIVTSGR